MLKLDPDLLTLKKANAVLADVRFSGYTFEIHGTFEPGKPTYLRGVFMASHSLNPKEICEQHTRKWLLSPYMTRSELVQTAFKCVLTSVEHEAREQFTYKGAQVFGPHFNVDALVACALSIDVRKEPA